MTRQDIAIQLLDERNKHIDKWVGRMPHDYWYDIAIDERIARRQAEAERDELIEKYNNECEASEYWNKMTFDLEHQLADARKWNESVRVCAKHTREIVGDGCVICELDEAEMDYTSLDLQLADARQKAEIFESACTKALNERDTARDAALEEAAIITGSESDLAQAIRALKHQKEKP